MNKQRDKNTETLFVGMGEKKNKKFIKAKGEAKDWGKGRQYTSSAFKKTGERTDRHVAGVREHDGQTTAARSTKRTGARTETGSRPLAKPMRIRRENTASFDGSHSGVTHERIAKRLARAGLASRREAEAMILSGRIGVNGKRLTSPAFNVSHEDVITVDGKPLPPIERTRLWLYHKPAGLVTSTRDDEGRPTVFAHLPEGMPRVVSVGRLDINTEGLLLLTNDGGLARILELPSTGWLRRYRVRAHGRVREAELSALKEGIAIDGIFYGAIEATIEREQGSHVWLTMGLREGKNREVKNILGHLGLEVARLIRISFGPFQLADIEVGGVREIKGRTLREQLGERLIEDSGANFEVPILTHLTKTGTIVPKNHEEQAEGAVRRREWISSSPSTKRNSREADKKLGEESKKSRSRKNTANVWMAPGARPSGQKPSAKRSQFSDKTIKDKMGGDRNRRPSQKPKVKG